MTSDSFGSLTTLEDWTSESSAIPEKPTYHSYSSLKSELNKFFPTGSKISLLELGCGSGCFIKYILDLLSISKDSLIFGLDWSKELGKLFSSNLNSLGYYNNNFELCNLVDEDLSTTSHSSSFDLVVSGGLVEHFIGSSFEHVLNQHLHSLKPGGIAIVSLPNMHGVRYFWHSLFDYSSFKLHSLDSMSLSCLSSYYSCFGNEILLSTYTGGFNLWWSDPYKLPTYKRIIASFFMKIWNKLFIKVFRPFLEKHPYYFASTLVLVVKKPYC